MRFLFLVLKESLPRVASIARGPGIVLYPFLCLVGLLIISIRPSMIGVIRSKVMDERKKQKLKENQNDLYPLW